MTLLRQNLLLSGQSLLLVQGSGSRHFLQGLLTKDIDSLSTVPLVYSFLLNVKGRVLTDLFIHRLGSIDSEEFVLETARERVGLLEKALKLYRLRKKIKIEPLLDKTVHFHIPEEAGTANQVVGNKDGWLADPRVSGFGFRCLKDSSSTSISLGSDEKEASSSVYLRHRLDWGLAEGEEMADQIPLNMNGDIINGISFEKGCYIGQELVARTHHTGIVRRRLMPFKPIDDDNGDGFRSGNLTDARGKKQGKIICSYGHLGGLCLASLDIVSDPSAPPTRLFDSSSSAIAVHRPHWWPPIS